MTFGCVLIASALCSYAVSGIVAADGWPTFDSFVKLHGRSYNNQEYSEREALYASRIQAATLHNNNPNRRWTAGINYLTDWTEAELATLRGWNGHGMKWSSNQATWDTSSDATSVRLTQDVLPQNLSWLNLTTFHKHFDQGACGSCWAAAAATVLNSHAEKHFGAQARTFSAQELVSCVPNPQECGGTGGCSGATVELALDYVLKNGLATENEVPYSGSSSKCQRLPPKSFLQMKPAGRAFKMRTWTRLPENKYEPLMRAVAIDGPVAVSVGASKWSLYVSGIFDSCDKNVVVNHAVTMIGYGQSVTGDKYWLIRNSWGSTWGENGNIRMLRRDSDDRECGIDSDPKKGTACKDGPSQVTVCGMCGVLYDSALPVFGA